MAIPFKHVSVPMAKMSFTIPDEVRERFERAFQEDDRSAVVTALLLLAVQAEERGRPRSASLLERLRRVGNGNLPSPDGPIRRAALAE